MRRVLAFAVSGGFILASGLCIADEPAKPSGNAPCVDVQIGNEHANDLACLNQRLRAFAAQQQGVAIPAPIGTHSSSVSVGAANQAAAQQMMGNAFGKSAIPQRPHPVYISPLPGVPAQH